MLTQREIALLAVHDAEQLVRSMFQIDPDCVVGIGTEVVL